MVTHVRKGRVSTEPATRHGLKTTPFDAEHEIRCNNLAKEKTSHVFYGRSPQLNLDGAQAPPFQIFGTRQDTPTLYEIGNEILRGDKTSEE